MGHTWSRRGTPQHRVRNELRRPATGADRCGDHSRPGHSAQGDRMSRQPVRGQYGAVTSPAGARRCRAPALPAQESRCQRADTARLTAARPNSADLRPAEPANLRAQTPATEASTRRAESALRAGWRIAGLCGSSRSVTAAPTATAISFPAMCGAVVGYRADTDARGRLVAMGGRDLPLALAGGWRPDRAAPAVAP